jgi:formate--tetrahydrofolate ligase
VLPSPGEPTASLGRTLVAWGLTFAVNVTGSYLVADETAAIWKEQGLPAALVLTTMTAGAIELAEAVVKAIDGPITFEPLNKPGDSIKQQIETIATRIYGADGVDYLPQANKDIKRMEDLGFSDFPVCMAKTHLSLSHDPAMGGRPKGWRLPVRAVVPSAGAGFVVALCGDMQRMPGLGKTPAFKNVDIDAEGRTVGLF